MSQKVKQYNRKRPYVFNFRVSKEELVKLSTLILLSGKTKNQFLIDALLHQRPELIGGKFASNRLAQEIKDLVQKLDVISVPDELSDLLVECRELVRQLISLLKQC